MKQKQNLHQQASDKTRSKILEAARILFVELGFSATSIGAIAKKASINQSLIYHYFENKEDLWRQVKSTLISNINDPKDLKNAPPIETLEELLEHLVRLRYQYYAQNPELVRMMLWQALEVKGTNIAGTSEVWMHSWLETIAKLQKQKQLSLVYSPEEIMMLLNGIVWGPFISQPILEKHVDGMEFCKKMLTQLKILLSYA